MRILMHKIRLNTYLYALVYVLCVHFTRVYIFVYTCRFLHVRASLYLYVYMIVNIMSNYILCIRE